MTVLQAAAQQQISDQQNIHYSRHKLSRKHIDLTFEEIKSERIARMTGLISHFVYWCVFGQINQMPLDEYHTKQLFISIAQCMSELTQHFSSKKQLFSNFIMPMILLAIRVEMEVMLKGSYPLFLANKNNVTETLRLVNGVIT